MNQGRPLVGGSTDRSPVFSYNNTTIIYFVGKKIEATGTNNASSGMNTQSNNTQEVSKRSYEFPGDYSGNSALNTGDYYYNELREILPLAVL